MMGTVEIKRSTLSAVIILLILLCGLQIWQSWSFKRQLVAVNADLHAELKRLEQASPPVPPPGVLAAMVVNPGMANDVAEQVIARLQGANLGRQQGAQPNLAPVASADPPLLSAAQQAAQDEAERTLERALNRGRLSREDVMAIRDRLADNPKAMNLIRQRVTVAINLDKLIPEDPHFMVP